MKSQTIKEMLIQQSNTEADLDLEGVLLLLKNPHYFIKYEKGNLYTHSFWIGENKIGKWNLGKKLKAQDPQTVENIYRLALHLKKVKNI